jgi:hypothetical protein
MAALAANRNTQEDTGKRFVYPLADNVIVYLGSIVVLDASGNAKPGVVATGLKAVGVAAQGYQGSFGNSGFGPLSPGNSIDNTGVGHAAGAMSVECRRGTWKFDNYGTDPVVAGDIGNVCFIYDDHTVSHSDGGATQSVAGRVEQIDSDGGIWVNFEKQSAAAS